MQGSYYYLGEQRLGQGKEAVSALLAQDEALTQQLTQQVRAAISAATAGGDLAAATAEEGEDFDMELEEQQATTA